jgi:hypothetical protein
LDELNLTTADLKWCYAASGCDNITGIRQIGFQTALSACRQHADVLDRLPNVGDMERERVRTELNRYLLQQNNQPFLVRLPLEATSLLHRFVFQMKVNDNGEQVRKRLLKISRWHPPMDASINTYGLVVPPPPAPRFALGTTGHRDFNRLKRLEIMNVDSNKAINSYNYWTTLENLEAEPEQQPEPIEGSTRSTTKIYPPKAAPKTNQRRVQSTHTKHKRELDLYHPMVTRTAPTIGTIAIIPGFADWFQTHIKELKVSNN